MLYPDTNYLNPRRVLIALVFTLLLGCASSCWVVWSIIDVSANPGRYARIETERMLAVAWNSPTLPLPRTFQPIGAPCWNFLQEEVRYNENTYSLQIETSDPARERAPGEVRVLVTFPNQHDAELIFLGRRVQACTYDGKP